MDTTSGHFWLCRCKENRNGGAACSNWDGLSVVLDKKQLFDNLSKTDIEGLTNFFPKFVHQYGQGLKKPEKLLAISGTHQVELVYLDNVIKKYERRLRRKTQNEHSWQRFLGDYILFFSANYASTLEKESIDLRAANTLIFSLRAWTVARRVEPRQRDPPSF